MDDRVSEADRAAILSLIEAETAAFWRKDFEGWSRYWLHEPFVRRWGWWAAHGGMTLRDGWTDHAARMREMMAANPLPNLRSLAEVRREHVTMRAIGDMAWVTCDQIAPATGDGMDVAGLSRELRILERHGGEWRFACICFFQRSLSHLHAAVVHVDADARVQWLSTEAEAELAASSTIGMREGRLRASDKGADQRLQSLIRWAAHLDDGMYSARAALPIVLDAGHGTPANVCWVIGESGYVLVALNDARMTDERLATGALVYGLTPAQLRVVRLIAAGHDVVDAARQLKISVNTARTHLQRTYDKTGVRSQPMLVRALLSVSPPL